jgi:hypothetical protein
MEPVRRNELMLPVAFLCATVSKASYCTFWALESPCDTGQLQAGEELLANSPARRLAWTRQPVFRAVFENACCTSPIFTKTTISVPTQHSDDDGALLRERGCCAQASWHGWLFEGRTSGGLPAEAVGNVRSLILLRSLHRALFPTVIACLKHFHKCKECCSSWMVWRSIAKLSRACLTSSCSSLTTVALS